MRKARQVTIVSGAGVAVIEEGPLYDSIEVHIEEFPDHIDTVIAVYKDGVRVRECINCPVDIIYKEAVTP